jgi:membrane fusion protein, copper/silver efflux system
VRTLVAIALVLFAACKSTDTAAPSPHAGHTAAAVDPHAGHGNVPEGHAEVMIPRDQQERVGLKVARVERRELGGVVRATATLQPDEQREAHVHSKLMGYVRELFVNKIGQRVKKGQALYTIYSQDLLVAQQEYLRARKFSTDLADAARERLRLWDIPDDQVRAIEERGAPLETVTVRSPIAGTVVEKSIVAGHFVEPDMMLYRIADLSRLWVVADVYEYELGRIDRTGKAVVRVEGVERAIEAPIDYVYPTVDPGSRTVKVRLVVDNKDGSLRPGNFATVELPTRGDAVLTVPEEAVIDTGVRQVVYVLGDGDRPESVAVELGRRVGGRAEIRAGLTEGDPVVVSAQFLVDSESRLRAGGEAPGHGGH